MEFRRESELWEHEEGDTESERDRKLTVQEERKVGGEREEEEEEGKEGRKKISQRGKEMS